MHFKKMESMQLSTIAKSMKKGVMIVLSDFAI